MNGLPTFMTASVYMLSYSLVFCSRRTVGLSLLPVLTGTDMPPAKVFHQKLRWLKVEGGGKFSAVGMPQPQVFLEQCSSRLFMWKITVITYFSLPILSSPPKKHDILGDRATVFYKLAYSPIEFSVLPLYYPPDMYGTFIYSTHTGRYMCTQAHQHQRTHTHTHTGSHIIPTRIHIFVNTALKRRHPRQMFPVVFSFGFSVLLEVTLLILRICNAGCLHLGVCWVGRMQAALFMMRQTGSKW